MQLLTVAEAARRLAVHPDTIRNLADRGQLNAVRIGRAVRIDEAELDQLVSRQRPRRVPPAPAPLQATPGQNRAFHKKCDVLGEKREQPGRQVKVAAKAGASRRLGREIASVKDLSEGEMSDVLDWLDEAIESL